MKICIAINFSVLEFTEYKKKQNLEHILILYFSHKTNSTYPTKIGQSCKFTFG